MNPFHTWKCRWKSYHTRTMQESVQKGLLDLNTPHSCIKLPKKKKSLIKNRIAKMPSPSQTSHSPSPPTLGATHCHLSSPNQGQRHWEATPFKASPWLYISSTSDCFLLWNRILLCSSGWSWTWGNPPASATASLVHIFTCLQKLASLSGVGAWATSRLIDGS